VVVVGMLEGGGRRLRGCRLLAVGAKLLGRELLRNLTPEPARDVVFDSQLVIYLSGYASPIGKAKDEWKMS